MRSLLQAKAWLLALATSLALTASGHTADLANDVSYGDVVPASIWTGLYIGAHGGWATGQWDGPLSYEDAHKYPKLKFDGSDKAIDGEGAFGGAQIGYNHQLGTSVVVGLEADISFGKIEGEGEFLPYPDAKGSPAWRIKSEMDLFGTVRGRIGVLAQPNLLLYATGGFAWAQVDSEISPVYGKFVNGSAEAENNHIGWTVGGGAEWALTDHISIKAEYLYLDLGKQDYGYAGTDAKGVPYATDHHLPDLEFHVVKGGLNYRF